ncbi:MAG: glycine cleavage system aminomethyltransferase GcvT [Chloroherpetonaceae bacterium]|nr:glycine cleavage system aminomethyltransferase GcvT [Chloroherpetonaceae bacterium]MDW8436977.1 glycine cleavage system aminomethyltransferase GcvT [Chloroherpetonaceae bacterium]
MKRTPLYDLHKSRGAKFIEFGGFEMPLQYEGIIAEHKAVRESVGVFDVSHMGEVEIKGENALAFLQKVTTNDVAQLYDGKAQYATMLYENDSRYPDGGAVDDFIVSRISATHFFLVVNASNIEKDVEWLRRNATEGVEIVNRSDELSLLAVQGRNAEATLQKLTSLNLAEIRYYHFERGKLANVEMMISRTGYTGEDGFELCFPNEFAEQVWNAILEAGKPFHIKPIGLGARDTLRLEMGYALYGHELDETTNPIEAGLGWVVKFGKGDFNGKQACLNAKEKPRKKLIGFVLKGKSVARQGYEIANKNGETIGQVRSGTLSPTLEKPIGTGFVRPECATVGDHVFVKIRGELCEAEIVKPPFLKK